MTQPDHLTEATGPAPSAADPARCTAGECTARPATRHTGRAASGRTWQALACADHHDRAASALRGLGFTDLSRTPLDARPIGGQS